MRIHAALFIFTVVLFSCGDNEQHVTTDSAQARTAGYNCYAGGVISFDIYKMKADTGIRGRAGDYLFEDRFSIAGDRVTLEQYFFYNRAFSIDEEYFMNLRIGFPRSYLRSGSEIKFSQYDTAVQVSVRGGSVWSPAETHSYPLHGTLRFETINDSNVVFIEDPWFLIREKDWARRYIYQQTDTAFYGAVPPGFPMTEYSFTEEQ